ncbi:MAG: hypothetical protein MK141_14310 [Pseudoxanthomonas sp.]|uniref:hypothetical protein n=1 Tax=Pseudoxanthomonas sp. TaxID=1871049 RepID=UPI0025838FDB|nr:hypothetical protein [Pseudoxanthomonas sp.]MCH2092733.1 hypothetical protein [Pseudoxanthomonas sp.]
MKLIVFLLVAAVVYLALRLRKVERTLAKPVPSAPSNVQVVIQDHGVRLQALEISDRKRTLFEMLR